MNRPRGAPKGSRLSEITKRAILMMKTMLPDGSLRPLTRRPFGPDVNPVIGRNPEGSALISACGKPHKMSSTDSLDWQARHTTQDVAT